MTAATGTTLQQHPLSAAFPAMPDDELEALAEDIKQNGQREPGVIYEDKVLDGWHRLLACQKAGVAFISVQYKGEDPVAFVLSKNLLRRHLTGSQKAAAIVACSNWRPSGTTTRRGEPSSSLTNAQMAAAAEVSERTIQHAKVAHQAGLGEVVREGKVSARTAAEVAKLSPVEREKAVKAIKEGRSRETPKTKKTSPADKELAEWKAKYADLQERYETLAETARDLQDKVTALEAKDPDEQQQEIMRLQKYIKRLEQEIEHHKRARNDCQNKNNELIRQVKLLQRKQGGR